MCSHSDTELDPSLTMTRIVSSAWFGTLDVDNYMCPRLLAAMDEAALGDDPDFERFLDDHDATSSMLGCDQCHRLIETIRTAVSRSDSKRRRHEQHALWIAALHVLRDRMMRSLPVVTPIDGIDARRDETGKPPPQRIYVASTRGLRAPPSPLMAA